MSRIATTNGVSQRVAASRTSCVVVRAERAVPRRALLSTAGAALLLVSPAKARDYKEALAA